MCSSDLGVDDRFTHRDADPVQLVLVHAGLLADVIGDDLHEIQHVERAVEFEADGARRDHLKEAQLKYHSDLERVKLL